MCQPGIPSCACPVSRVSLPARRAALRRGGLTPGPESRSALPASELEQLGLQCVGPRSLALRSLALLLGFGEPGAASVGFVGEHEVIFGARHEPSAEQGANGSVS